MTLIQRVAQRWRDWLAFRSYLRGFEQHIAMIEARADWWLLRGGVDCHQFQHFAKCLDDAVLRYTKEKSAGKSDRMAKGQG